MKSYRNTILALVLIFSISCSVFAESNTTADVLQSTINSYKNYLDSDRSQQRVLAEVMIPPEKIVAEPGGATAQMFENKPAIESKPGDMTTWGFEVGQAGYYNLEIEYFMLDGTGGTAERNIYIDGAVPFNESRGILLKREYAYDNEKIYNTLGNEILSERSELRQWRTITVSSSAGYISEELLFYFDAGKHTLSLEAVKEPAMYGNLRLYRKQPLKTYEEIKEEYSSNRYPVIEGQSQVLQAEEPASVSDYSIYPTSDRTSAYTSPQSDSKIMLNVIGGENWKIPGQYIRYSIKVEQSGLYTIGFRYKQDISQGLSVYRKLMIDGTVPFQEANDIKFNYDNGWQSMYIGNDKENYLFYLSADKTHELTLVVTCGEYSSVLSELNDCLSSLNAIYKQILMITGPDPDLYRDYKFKSLIPETIQQLVVEQERLNEIKKEIARISSGDGSQVTAIENLIIQLKKMHEKPEKNIASNLESFQSNISSLGTWIMNCTNQPLMLDTILVNADSKGDTGFFRTIVFEIKRLIASFFNDYSVAGIKENKNMPTINVWIYSGRDQAQILRNLIDNTFVDQEGVAVNLKLATAGALMPAVLANKGPDVSLTAASSEPMNLAIRNAIVDLSEFEDCAEVLSRFKSSAVEPFTYRGQVFALPETQSFFMMFCRTDILDELNIKIPTTWDDLYDCMLDLQTHNLETGLPIDAYNSMMMFLGQNNGKLYSEDGKTSLLDSDIALSCFKELMNFYKLYDFSVQYDFANRFRSGEMPIAIQQYDTAYNQLTLFAPEIKGLWSMVPIPGTVNANGKINNSSPGIVTGSIIMKQTKQKEACWKFLKWWTSEKTQGEFGMQLESVIGDGAKYATANVAALAGSSWSYQNINALNSQWENVIGIPEVPGGYYSSRYIGFAFNKVINDSSANAQETLENYVPIITNELQRKAKEFGY